MFALIENTHIFNITAGWITIRLLHATTCSPSRQNRLFFFPLLVSEVLDQVDIYIFVATFPKIHAVPNLSSTVSNIVTQAVEFWCRMETSDQVPTDILLLFVLIIHAPSFTNYEVLDVQCVSYYTYVGENGHSVPFALSSKPPGVHSTHRHLRMNAFEWCVMAYIIPKYKLFPYASGLCVYVLYWYIYSIVI